MDKVTRKYIVYCLLGETVRREDELCPRTCAATSGGLLCVGVSFDQKVRL
ncbi:hypothetical protein BRARA_B00633 [Brassica rapa]|uniref:Uncharacterized protein n=1 Tax=Brassica campestris TaxID=3711 RepID=A0A398A6Q4_BRACM|nr:hypothetical protein BRARA_B00633 [Brassica rapa]